ncbi:MAG TPA: hypothetical protein VHE59_11920 [Mucilaginibacter sp.]|nr:hypothetical protein [Mucilaginibacter sp.]
MHQGLSKENPVVRLRVFRAIDDPATCELFVAGHTQVLTNIGVTKVTSSKHEWTTNPAAFVIIVESLDATRVYGGARVHVAGGTEPLPIEQATVAMDPSVVELVWRYAQKGTGEICGLWNSREIAGYGIGSIFLTRAAVAISSQIGLTSLFALCAQYTVAMAESVGYHKEPGIGNNGTFYYPKMDLLATAMLHEDIETLATANVEERAAILRLRKNLNMVRVEVLRKKSIEIHYELEIRDLYRWNLADTIANARRNYYETEWGEMRLNLL